jgi:hypothetical protein
MKYKQIDDAFQTVFLVKKITFKILADCYASLRVFIEKFRIFFNSLFKKCYHLLKSPFSIFLFKRGVEGSRLAEICEADRELS